MGIAHRRVGDEHALLVAHPVREFLRTELREKLACTACRQLVKKRCLTRLRRDFWRRPPFRFGVAVDRDVGDVGQ